MKDRIRQIKIDALSEIASCVGSAEALEALRVKYLGRKGIVAELFKEMSALPLGEKREAGQVLNALKTNLANALDGKTKGLSKSGVTQEAIDITLPGIYSKPGNIHPITKTINEICDIFISLGFRIIEGPEIETEYYNFEALNIPLEHPSRDAFDTFYLRNEPRTTNNPAKNRGAGESPRGDYRKFLLRSHTSPVQARFMEKNKPPFSIIVPGRVYRPDATDASHSFMFHQIEGLAVSGDIKFSDLKGVLNIFAKQMFGKKTKTRFRPSFFPFTEPSAEVDVLWGEGWLEILGAGMVNPKVFKAVGYDPEKVTGFAFGMGVERIAMLKYGINDIRLFFENDVRFLRQF